MNDAKPGNLRPPALRVEDLQVGYSNGAGAVTALEIERLSVPGGALLAVMRAVLDGHAPRDTDIHHAEGILRLLGLTATDAAEVARRPLPGVS